MPHAMASKTLSAEQTQMLKAMVQRSQEAPAPATPMKTGTRTNTSSAKATTVGAGSGTDKAGKPRHPKKNGNIGSPATNTVSSGKKDNKTDSTKNKTHTKKNAKLNKSKPKQNKEQRTANFNKSFVEALSKWTAAKSVPGVKSLADVVTDTANAGAKSTTVDKSNVTQPGATDDADSFAAEIAKLAHEAAAAAPGGDVATDDDDDSCSDLDFGSDMDITSIVGSDLDDDETVVTAKPAKNKKKNVVKAPIAKKDVVKAPIAKKDAVKVPTTKAPLSPSEDNKEKTNKNADKKKKAKKNNKVDNSKPILATKPDIKADSTEIPKQSKEVAESSSTKADISPAPSAPTTTTEKATSGVEVPKKKKKTLSEKKKEKKALRKQLSMDKKKARLEARKNVDSKPTDAVEYNVDSKSTKRDREETDSAEVGETKDKKAKTESVALEKSKKGSETANSNIKSETADTKSDVKATEASSDATVVKDKKSKKEKKEKKSHKEVKKVVEQETTADESEVAAKSASPAESGFNNWGNADFDGDSAKKNKFLRLMGAGKTAAASTPKNTKLAATGKSTVDSSAARKMMEEMDSEYVSAIQMKAARNKGGKRIGLGR